MGAKQLTLSDLTKEELIRLIETKMFFSIEYEDIWWVRYESLNAQACDKRHQSIALGHGPATFMKSMKLWDDAERIQKRADALYSQNMNGGTPRGRKVLARKRPLPTGERISQQDEPCQPQ